MSALITIVIISIFCNGIYIITRQGLLLGFIHEWYLSKAGGYFRADGEMQWNTCPHKPNPILKFIYKPLFGCLPCMASIWGSVAYWSICDSVAFYPIAIISAACVNLIINQIYDK
jgi:hypothetical protein